MDVVNESGIETEWELLEVEVEPNTEFIDSKLEFKVSQPVRENAIMEAEKIISFLLSTNTPKILRFLSLSVSSFQK